MSRSNTSQKEVPWKRLKSLLKKHDIEVFADGIGNIGFDYKDGNENISLGGYIDMPDEEYSIATKWFVNGKRKPFYNKWTIISDESSSIKHPNACRFSEQNNDWMYSMEYIQKLIEAKNQLKEFLEQKQVQRIRTKYKEAHLQTCYSCNVDYNSSKKCWMGTACIHGKTLKGITGKTFSDVLEKILQTMKLQTHNKLNKKMFEPLEGPVSIEKGNSRRVTYAAVKRFTDNLKRQALSQKTSIAAILREGGAND